MDKSIAAKILCLIFLANFFYEENQQFLYKRVVYSVFIYWAIFEIVTYTYNSWTEEFHSRMPKGYRQYLIAYLLFIACNIITDFRNPNLNLVTLANNPQATLSVVPVFLFAIGVLAEDLSAIFKLLRIICFVFMLTWIAELPGRVPFYQGYIASHAVLPLFLMSWVDRKKMAFSIGLVVASVLFSMFSNYRIITLQILFFFGFFISLGLVKNSVALKVLVIMIAGTFVFLMLNNLEDMLNAFKSVIGKSDFDGDDTRSFLYRELFTDMSNWELITGRGFLGTYFSEYFLMLIQNKDDTGDFYQRFGVEVGFLQLILKGGFVYYFLYTLPLWYVSIRSIFWYAHLKIPFYIGIFILTELLLMFFENIPYFNFQFSILFLFAGFAYRVTYMKDQLDELPVTRSSAEPNPLVSV